MNIQTSVIFCFLSIASRSDMLLQCQKQQVANIQKKVYIKIKFLNRNYINIYTWPYFYYLIQ